MRPAINLKTSLKFWPQNTKINLHLDDVVFEEGYSMNLQAFI
jgi:hypothetical protein